MLPKSLPSSIFRSQINFHDARGHLTLVSCPTIDLRCPDGRRLGKPDQVVLSHTKPKTGRGLHFQKTEPLLQFISVLSGSINECLVRSPSIDPTSPNAFECYRGVISSGSKKNSFFIPRGWAHGFYTVEEAATLLYLIWGERNVEYETGYNFFDPAFGFFDESHNRPRLNKRDANYDFL